MDSQIETLFNDAWSTDRTAQSNAYYALMRFTSEPVDWAYAVWDTLVANLTHKDNHIRAIASQLLCQLAQSDPENRILTDFDALLTVTRDTRFVTARHCLQAMWQIGVVGQAQRDRLLAGFSRRFADCQYEKQCTIIRFDICQGLRQLYNRVQDNTIREQALALIETEPDLKYRKKYAGVWKLT